MCVCPCVCVRVTVRVSASLSPTSLRLPLAVVTSTGPQVTSCHYWWRQSGELRRIWVPCCLSAPVSQFVVDKSWEKNRSVLAIPPEQLPRILTVLGPGLAWAYSPTISACVVITINFQNLFAGTGGTHRPPCGGMSQAHRGHTQAAVCTTSSRYSQAQLPVMGAHTGRRGQVFRRHTAHTGWAP
jgi:hypothetical protein